MSPKSFFLAEDLHAYLVDHGSPPDDHLARLTDRTAALGPVARMQVAPEQGALLTMLVRLTGARSIVEVGTFTGYSTLCLARGLDGDGRILACDVNTEWTKIALAAWAEAGVADLVDLRIAPALETLRALPTSRHVDLAFIDADKPGYLGYYEELVPRMRPGGLVLADNVLWSGAVVDPDVHDPDTEAIRAFNDRVAADDRVEAVMLPVSDGLTLIRCP